MSVVRRVGDLLGEGASGRAYEAHFEGEDVVVKVVEGPLVGPAAKLDKTKAWAREKRSSLMIKRNPHRNIMPCLAAFEASHDVEPISAGDGLLLMPRGVPLPYPVGERDEYGAVMHRTDEEQLRAAVSAAEIAVCLTNALGHLHAVLQTVHRDVKPDNVMRVNGQPCLFDFSAAKVQLYRMHKVRKEGRVGTLGFLAPEMYAKDAIYCSKIDIWSLGCTAMAFFNDGKPFGRAEFYGLTMCLEHHAEDRDRMASACDALERSVNETLARSMHGDHPTLSALRGFICLCLRASPAERSSAQALLRSEELRLLAQATGLELDSHPDDQELFEDRVERSAIVASMMQEYLQRFDLNGDGQLDASEMAMIRGGIHRALEEGEHIQDLMSCWLELTKSCPDPDFCARDECTGRNLLHAVVQNDLAGDLLGFLEDSCKAMPRGEDMLAALLSARDFGGNTALGLAATRGTSPLVCTELLDLRADVNAANHKGSTPLRCCVEACTAISGGQCAHVLEVLIASGATVPRELKASASHLPLQARLALKKSQGEVSGTLAKYQEDLQYERQERAATQNADESRHQRDETDVYTIEIDELMDAVFSHHTLKVLSSDSPPLGIEEIEAQLREYLKKASCGHALTAFKMLDKDANRKVTADEMLLHLDNAVPGLAPASRQQMRKRWGRAMDFRLFNKWLAVRSASDSKASAVRTLEKSADDDLRRMLVNLFNSLDSDEDGVLTGDELASGLDIWIQCSGLRQWSDKEQDESSDLSTWLKHTMGRMESMDDVLLAFQSWDSSGDGCIDREELATVLRTINPLIDVDRFFTAADLNGDGVISYKEFLNWIFWRKLESSEPKQLKRTIVVTEDRLSQVSSFIEGRVARRDFIHRARKAR